MILDQFKAKQIEFMKSKQAEKLDVLRFFIAQVKNKEIELRPQNQELTDELVFKVLRKLIKQADETIEMCQKANRVPALERAQKEKIILQEFLQLFPSELLEQAAAQDQKSLEFKQAHSK